MQWNATFPSLRTFYSIFNRLRTLLFAGSNKCLLLALALRLFMQSHGIRPAIVLAVTSDPFRAHAWVQFGPLIFDKRPEGLDIMTPILSV